MVGDPLVPAPGRRPAENPTGGRAVVSELPHPPIVPLVVDMDGTLLRTDLLHESALIFLRQGPQRLLQLPLWLATGKARMKREIAQRVTLDPSCLPYHHEFLDWIRSEHERGRSIVLATGSDLKLAQIVAEHLGLFDDVLASDGSVNNSSRRKAEALVDRYGERGFDYAGNSRDDLAVWKRARRAIVVSASSDVRRAASERFEVEREFAGWRGGPGAWFRALRLHQWMKNLLLFLPLLGAHRIFEPTSLKHTALAFVAFGLCASAIYVINDLVDLEHDRQHPRKRLRPFARGELSLLSGVVVCAALLAASVALALAVGFAFSGWLLLYFGLTASYTFWLKRKEVVDALSLAALYTLRILAGGAAAGLHASFWLLAFSMFLFLSLAFVKRFSELRLMLEEGQELAKGRGYRVDDLPLIEMMGVVAGFAAVIVLALYINGETISILYRRPEIMWLAVPLLLYWISRIWIKAHRGLMHDDPVFYAMKDWISIISGVLFIGVMWAAT
jgi:4-hydroxybenzoate polyprenyltransferase/phosphoserine phosphatase